MRGTARRDKRSVTLHFRQQITEEVQAVSQKEEDLYEYDARAYNKRAHMWAGPAE